MLPFFVSCNQLSSKLYPLNDGRFQIIDIDGSIAPLMCGFQYALVEVELANFIKSIGVERVAFEAAIIFSRRKNEEYRSHYKMLVNQFFSASEINDLNIDDDRFLIMEEEYLFVSPSLKEKLENSPFKYLKFSKGLESFAGFYD